MLDFNHQSMKMINISQEDKALLRSNLSAWLMPGDGQEYMSCHMLLPFRSSSGPKAINLLSWCKAPTKVKTSQGPSTGRTYVRFQCPLRILIFYYAELYTGSNVRSHIISYNIHKYILFNMLRFLFFLDVLKKHNQTYN